MSNKTLPNRELIRNPRQTKQATEHGPVFITDRGQLLHVLLSIEAYRKLAGEQDSIVDLLAQPGSEEIDFQPGRVAGLILPKVDLD